MQNVYIFLPYITADRTAVIDRKVEITSMSPYLHPHIVLFHNTSQTTEFDASFSVDTLLSYSVFDFILPLFFRFWAVR